MTSIVITPFDSEHTEELKEFLWKVIDRADFAECMPPSVCIEDVAALKRQRDRLLLALKEIADDYEDRFDMHDPSTNPGIKYVIKQARDAIKETE
jgi:hypothetical protein